jgi:hypothetical protein
MMIRTTRSWEADMSIVVTDQELLRQLRQASECVEFRDVTGNLLGTFARPYGKLPPGVSSPLSDTEIERRRQEPDGRALDDILRDLAEHSDYRKR